MSRATRKQRRTVTIKHDEKGFCVWMQSPDIGRVWIVDGSDFVNTGEIRLPLSFKRTGTEDTSKVFTIKQE